jgi:hypothetical protein
MGGESVGQSGVSPVNRHGVLSKIIRSHTEEGAHLRQPIGHQDCCGSLDHNSYGNRWRGPDTVLLQVARLFHYDLPRFLHLVHGGHEREHEVEIMSGRGPQNGTNLGAEHLGLIETDPDGAPTKERIGFNRSFEGGRELVAPKIERADHHRLIGKGQCHPPKVFGLFVLGRQAGTPGQQKFGPEQPHPLGPMADGRLDLLRQVNVPHQRDGPARGRDCRLTDHRLQLQLEPMSPADLDLGLLELISIRIQHDRSALTIEQKCRAGRDSGQGTGCSHYGRDP